MTEEKIVIFWFRRDLRLDDNTALTAALNSGYPVLPVFIYDENILSDLPVNDARINFIYDTLQTINIKLNKKGSSVKIYHGKPDMVWLKILNEFNVARVYFNKDYEPYAISRDNAVKEIIYDKSINVITFKDQVIYEQNEIKKQNGDPYTVFTPYKNKWLELFSYDNINYEQNLNYNFYRQIYEFPSLTQIGFKTSNIKVKPYNLSKLNNYSNERDFPALNSGSYISPHLRFGTISIRNIIMKTKNYDITFLKELIWREFFMQILFNFPHVINENFHSKYNGIKWRNNENEFELWCTGNTGYPLVDAGMRQLTKTGYMHNRVRMVTAGFLTKHLLIDWRWGEGYFARHLLDYELSSNNGNWQWAAGTGCDAAPYFRIFNPETQLKKFDKNLEYIREWIPEINSSSYAKPVVDHDFARKRAIEAYKKGINN